MVEDSYAGVKDHGMRSQTKKHGRRRRSVSVNEC